MSIVRDTMSIDNFGRREMAFYQLSQEELAKLERQLLGTVNMIRRLQGKKPVIIPKEPRK